VAPRERDDELAQIQRLYRRLAALPYTTGARREPPEHAALVAEIRRLVDARTKIRGDEMIVIATGSGQGR